MAISDGALTGLDFIGDRATCEELVLAGQEFDPDDYEKKGEGWKLELVTETEDQVDIDGKLKVGYALLTGHSADLVVDKRIVVPNMTVAGAKFEDHFSLSSTYTHLLKDVTVSAGHFFSIAGWSFTRQEDTLKLDAPGGLWSRVLETRQGTLGSEDVTNHFGEFSVIGAGKEEAYTDKLEPDPVALTVGGDLSKF